MLIVDVCHFTGIVSLILDSSDQTVCDQSTATMLCYTVHSIIINISAHLPKIA